MSPENRSNEEFVHGRHGNGEGWRVRKEAVASPLASGLHEAIERAVFDAWAVREGGQPTSDTSWWHIHRGGPTHSKWAADAAFDAALPVLAAVERERDQLRAEKTAELDADAIIDAALRDASAATARANRAEAERDEARERLGDCIGCNYNDGPDECCPQHGRTVTEWIDIASDRIGTANDLRAERDAAVAENARLLARIAAVEAFCKGRAIGAHARGDSEAERAWLDALIVSERAALAASPTPTGPEPARPDFEDGIDEREEFEGRLHAARIRDAYAVARLPGPYRAHRAREGRTRPI